MLKRAGGVVSEHNQRSRGILEFAAKSGEARGPSTLSNCRHYRGQNRGNWITLLSGIMLLRRRKVKPSLERMGVNVSERINVGGFAEAQPGYLEWHQEYVFLRSRRTGDTQS
jgi:hypothetical protein